MKLDTYSVYPEIQIKGEFHVGRLYDGKGNLKFEIIKTNSEEVQAALAEEKEKYKVKGNK